MDDTASSFSTRSNAKRAAEQMIAKGTAPTVDYGIKPSNGRFEVVWKTALTPAEFAETAEAQANQASKAKGEDWPNTAATTEVVAGALGAAVFAFHHPGGTIPFIALWYGGSILLCALFGAIIGPRLLRW